MFICKGPIKSKNIKLKKINSPVSTIKCSLCSEQLKVTEKLSCINIKCNLVTHISCLADILLPSGEYIPIVGQCPFCKTNLKWGDLIRKMKGCNERNCNDESNEINNEERNDNDQESDDDVICTQDKMFVDTPSWFLDCNEDL